MTIYQHIIKYFLRILAKFYYECFEGNFKPQKNYHLEITKKGI